MNLSFFYQRFFAFVAPVLLRVENCHLCVNTLLSAAPVFVFGMKIVLYLSSYIMYMGNDTDMHALCTWVMTLTCTHYVHG